MTLHIDGTDEYGNYSGFANTPPFAVFDDVKQDWLICGLRWRWQAEMARSWFTKRVITKLALATGFWISLITATHAEVTCVTEIVRDGNTVTKTRTCYTPPPVTCPIAGKCFVTECAPNSTICFRRPLPEAATATSK